MNRKIIGVTVGSPLPKPNLMQTDPKKGDYVKGKEEFLEQINIPGSGGNVENGIPPGGKAGQYLCKKSDDDYDVEWTDLVIPEQYGLVTYDQDKTITIT